MSCPTHVICKRGPESEVSMNAAPTRCAHWNWERPRTSNHKIWLSPKINYLQAKISVWRNLQIYQTIELHFKLKSETFNILWSNFRPIVVLHMWFANADQKVKPRHPPDVIYFASQPTETSKLLPLKYQPVQPAYWSTSLLIYQSNYQIVRHLLQLPLLQTIGSPTYQLANAAADNYQATPEPTTIQLNYPRPTKFLTFGHAPPS